MFWRDIIVPDSMDISGSYYNCAKWGEQIKLQKRALKILNESLRKDQEQVTFEFGSVCERASSSSWCWKSLLQLQVLLK